MEPQWTQALLKSRRRKATLLAIVLGAVVLMFYLVTVVKLGANIMQRAL
ncbi:MAG: hypothetical protein HAW65_04560 [Alphaproteobacteria bacterium]|nr:hypothetical protein [Alphaproteobacteria bacterium]MBE8220559.1 hypothetical protein [Alphaproteobacteria bacterium]